MRPDLPVVIGPDALAEFIRFCRDRRLTHFALVADHNTFAALGARVQDLLQAEGWNVRSVIIEGDDIGADTHSVYQVLLGLDKTPHVFLAVGSGTITDITRFVSHRSNADFISLPTAPSVDGFTSIGAPMIIDGVKITVSCQGPLGVFADLPTLCAAPRPMLAAGVGDMLAKLTSVSDWELGHLLWDEPFDASIAARSRQAAAACAEHLPGIAAAQPEGVSVLMASLIESGFCMLDFGETRPASGYEHHMSHYWEMKLLAEGRHSVLHGAKVGIGVLISAALYDRIRRLSPQEVETRLAAAVLPARADEIARIRTAYGHPMADQVIAIQAPFLDMTPAQFANLKQRLLDHWRDIQRLAAAVPPADAIAGWLRQAGGPTTGEELGLREAEIAMGAASGHYYRNRFTIKKLARLLDITVPLPFSATAA